MSSEAGSDLTTNLMVLCIAMEMAAKSDEDCC